MSTLASKNTFPPIGILIVAILVLVSVVAIQNYSGREKKARLINDINTESK